jgi:hypothetical protein
MSLYNGKNTGDDGKKIYPYSYMLIKDRGTAVKDILIVFTGAEWYIALYASKLPNDAFGKNLVPSTLLTNNDLNSALSTYQTKNPNDAGFFLLHK